MATDDKKTEDALFNIMFNDLKLSNMSKWDMLKVKRLDYNRSYNLSILNSIFTVSIHLKNESKE